MNGVIEEKKCALCTLAVDHSRIEEDGVVFCCPGCRAVFAILQTQNQLADWKAHPLFQQALKSGLISNPELLEELDQQPAHPVREWEKYTFEIPNMWCSSCAEVIKWILLKEKGIRKCVVDYATDLVALEFSPRLIGKAKIGSILASLGYQVQSLEDSAGAKSHMDLYIRFGIAAFFTLNIMMFSYPIYASYFDQNDEGWGMLFAWLSLYASLPVVLYSGWPILRRFWTGMRVQILGMETLVAIGISTAFGLSLYELWHGRAVVYFDSMTAVITFVLLGKMIENKAKLTAKESIISLVKSLPKRARKKQADESFKFVPIRDVLIGDHMQILTGEKVNLDGIIVKGDVACDESLMTGEPYLIRKKPGDSVVAGSLIQQGTCVIQVTTTLAQTALHQIIHSVQEDMQHKARHLRAVDQVLKWFIPFVITFAALAAALFYHFGTPPIAESRLQATCIRFMTVLLISCPCAIGIAAPLAESYLIQGLAKLGALVRNRGCLKFLGRETLYVFDKTGTVTEGKFKVLGGLASLSQQQKALLKGLSSQSIHPISCAIAQAIPGRPVHVSQVKEYAGQGIEGEFEGKRYRLGSRQYLADAHISTAEIKAEHPHSVAYFSEANQCLAVIALGDSLKEHIQEVIKSLHPLKTFLLSGDCDRAVSFVAHTCGFTGFKGAVSPMAKKEHIATLRKNGEIVAMIGDGINDAPALANAHIGLCVANATDVSMQASDILLLSDNLHLLKKMRLLAQKGQRIVTQNLFWAFFYNVIGMFLAAIGYLNPIFAAFAMTASSVIVLLNAQRLPKK